MATDTDLDSIRRFIRGTDARYRLRPRPVQDVLRLFRELLDAGITMMQARADGEVSRYVTTPPEMSELISVCIAVFDCQISTALLAGEETVSIGLALEPDQLETVAGTIRAIAHFYTAMAGGNPEFPVPSLDALETMEGIYEELHELAAHGPVSSHA